MKQGFISPIQNNSQGFKKGILITLLPAVAFGISNAQCQGPDPDIQNQGFAGPGTANGLGLDMDGDNMDDLLFYAMGNGLRVRILAGTVFVTNSTVASASAIAYANNAPINGANDARPAPDYAYLAYGSLGQNGNFSSGTTANIGYRKGGNFGFITLTTNHVGGNPPWEITISQRGIDNNGSSSVTAADCTTLPVELMAFDANVKEETVALSWMTASEINNAGFEIERSENGKKFKTLAFVEGNGTSTQKQEYLHEDLTVHQGQLYYYRLKQIDFDGSFEYSEVITASLKGVDKTIGTFAPNPVASGLTQLSYYTPNAGQLSLQIFDIAGKELWKQEQEVFVGANTLNLDLSKLASGTYFVKMELDGSTLYEQIVIE